VRLTRRAFRRKGCFLAIALVLAAPLAGCEADEPERQVVDADIALTVRGEVAEQTIVGWGASVVTDAAVDPLVIPGDLSEQELERLDELVFEQAGINIVRVFGPGYDDQFGNVGAARPDDPRFAFMRRVARFGVEFMLTGADAPASIKEGKSLAHGREEAYADYLADILRLARDEIGVPFSYVAIANEPDNANALLTMSPEQAALVYKRLTERIISESLDAEVVLGDNTGWGDALQYARAELSVPDVARRAVAIASHSYRGAANEKRAVAEAAASAGLDVWQTEWGTGCRDCPDDRSMDLALEWSRQITTDLMEADVSAWFTFRAVADATHGPGDALIVRQRDHPEEPFYTTKRFDVFRHYSSVSPP
jgi:O-glycosyl hydrolase